jgi:hypothetical protein
LSQLKLLGSSTIQAGGIYDPADVQIVDCVGTSGADFGRVESERIQFAGQCQPKLIPQKDPGFFFNGECVATQVTGNNIMGHSCLLNLCLGGGGYNCLAIYHLSLEAQLNVDADWYAGKYQDKSGKFLPQCTIFPACPVMLSIREITVTSDYKNQLIQAYTEQQYIEYINRTNLAGPILLSGP